MRGKTVVIDIETNGLDPSIIWCIVAKDVHTGERFVFKNPDDVKKNFKAFTESVSTYICHNIVNYDMPVLNRLLGTTIKLEQVIDTLILSRLFNVSRRGEKLASGIYSQHSLEAWAIRLGKGLKKVQNEEWTTFSSTIVERCIADVDINEATYHALMQEGKEFSSECIRLEHDVAYINEQQKRRGFKVDFDILYPLQDKLIAEERTLRELVQCHFPPLPVLIREVRPRIKKDGTLSTVGLREIDPSTVYGSFSLIDWQPFNMESTPQQVMRLNRLGWKPIIFTDKGNPQVCDDNLATLPENIPLAGKYFTEYRMVTGRIKKIKEIFNGLGEDGRVHGECLHIGATTHRMAHNNPNMANIPAVDSPYGRDMRAMFHVPKETGWVLLGCDASGIQLRMLAHYINDPEFTNTLLTGDIHKYMASIYNGIPVEDVTKEMRTRGKTLTYAICFGAGAQRAASIFRISKAQGQEMIDRVQARIPGLARLKKEGQFAARTGHVKGLDGRLLPVTGSHLYLPALLQGGEQSAMKLAKDIWWHMAPKANIPMYDINFPDRAYKAAVVADVHDEWQTEVEKTHAKTLGELQKWSLEEAGRRLNLNCPLTGEYRIGSNWMETH